MLLYICIELFAIEAEVIISQNASSNGIAWRRLTKLSYNVWQLLEYNLVNKDDYYVSEGYRMLIRHFRQEFKWVLPTFMRRFWLRVLL